MKHSIVLSSRVLRDLSGLKASLPRGVKSVVADDDVVHVSREKLESVMFHLCRCVEDMQSFLRILDS